MAAAAPPDLARLIREDGLRLDFQAMLFQVTPFHEPACRRL